MKRSKFNLSYTNLFSCDMGELIPVGLLEVLPGDTIQISTAALLRCAPMLAPPMHPVDVRIHHWFVPNRLTWDSWEDFITGGPDGYNTQVTPYITVAAGGVAVGTLADYMGVPTGANATSINVNALPFRAYQLIWNEYYRDQDLQTKAVVSTADGVPDTTTSLSLQNCCWEKDYFTSARPWEQKGSAVTIPLTGSGTVTLVPSTTNSNANIIRTASDDSIPAAAALGSEVTTGFLEATGGGTNRVLDPNGRLTTSLTSAGVTVNALRQSLAIQRFEEARAMYGSRYPEYLRAIGVISSDARLQRPEYLGGGRQRIQFSEVLQTAADGSSPVSTLRGHGISAMRSNRVRRFFEEHGFLMTLMSVRPKTIYANGLHRHFGKFSKFDYWQKEFEHLGQQGVANKEVYMPAASPNAYFGYQDRYDEYRRMESRIGGEFRSSSLNFWHFARIFASEPALNATFVSAVPPERPFAAPSADVLYIQVHHSVQARRMLSVKASPRTF